MRFLLVFLFLIFACKDTVEKADQTNNDTSELSIVQTHNSVDLVMPQFQENIKDWESLNNVNVFLERFNKASANEVLSNSIELKSLSKALLDSVMPKEFKISSLKARINILYNESLRLEDMNDIPSISSKEVHEQTNKILDIFSSINSKINTVLRKKKFEEAIDVDVSYIGLDTTKIDSTSKKVIKENKLIPEKKLKPSLENLKMKNQ